MYIEELKHWLFFEQRKKKKNLSCNSDAFQELGRCGYERHVLFRPALGDGLVQGGPDLAQSTLVLASCHGVCIKWSWLQFPPHSNMEGQPGRPAAPDAVLEVALPVRATLGCAIPAAWTRKQRSGHSISPWVVFWCPVIISVFQLLLCLCSQNLSPFSQRLMCFSRYEVHISFADSSYDFCGLCALPQNQDKTQLAF